MKIEMELPSVPFLVFFFESFSVVFIFDDFVVDYRHDFSFFVSFGGEASRYAAVGFEKHFSPIPFNRTGNLVIVSCGDESEGVQCLKFTSI